MKADKESTTEKRAEHSNQEDAQQAVRYERETMHWWSRCPCGTGLRFSRCCGRSGGDVCDYKD
jgi:uncharacterized protein YchJ